MSAVRGHRRHQVLHTDSDGVEYDSQDERNDAEETEEYNRMVELDEIAESVRREREAFRYDLEEEGPVHEEAWSQQRNPRLRQFVFTQYNWEDDPREIYNGLYSYIIFQLEEGASNGTRHIQGYCQLKEQTSVKSIRGRNPLVKGQKGKGAWIAPARGTTKQNQDYCSKEDTRVPGTAPTEEGVPRKSNSRETNASIGRVTSRDKMLLEAVEGTFDHRKSQDHLLCAIKHAPLLRVAATLSSRPPRMFPDTRLFIHVGVSRSGKSYNAKYGVYDENGRRIGYNTETPDFFEVKMFQKDGSPWFDGYVDQTRLIINEVGPLGLSWPKLLEITDVSGGNFDRKGGSVLRNWSEVHLTSNYDPREWFADYVDLQPLLNRTTKIFHYTKTHPTCVGRVRTIDELVEEV